MTVFIKLYFLQDKNMYLFLFEYVLLLYFIKGKWGELNIKKSKI